MQKENQKGSVNLTPYQEFLKSKEFKFVNSGFVIDETELNSELFDFQKPIVKWAIRKGKSAVFADCGLGKTIIQLEWLYQTMKYHYNEIKVSNKYGLIVAPLSVASQTISEGEKFGYSIKYIESDTQATELFVNGTINIFITNYERLHNFTNISNIYSLVLDESSILKSIDGKTKNYILTNFNDIPYKLSCTATPAPNDITEIVNQASFLGLMSREEILSKFFVHDSALGEWRLKGHAEDSFYKWMSAWAVVLRKPSDIGFDDSNYILPELKMNPVFVESNFKRDDELFTTTQIKGITDRSIIRKATIDNKIEEITNIISNKIGNNEQIIIWAGLNDEADKLEKTLDNAIQLAGKDMKSDKVAKIDDFKSGNNRILITKPSIAGHGMNFQNCNNMIFIGLSDSYEDYYQCIRRCWRFGQTKVVNVWVVLTTSETQIFDNILNKENLANSIYNNLVSHISDFNKVELGIKQASIKDDYNEIEIKTNDYTIYRGDSIEIVKKIEDDSIDFSIFSPPFSSLYTYSPSTRDLGNCKDDNEFWNHFNYLISDLLRITKPGRICAVHCSQIPAMLVRDNYIGIKDFRGDVIRNFIDKGFIYHGEIAIDKNPQSQSIRTHAKGLTFTQLEKDSSWMRPALGDYICLFRKPGDNLVPVVNGNKVIKEHVIDRDEWIKLAHPIWYDISEGDVLNNYRDARTNDDEKHICPLQLETIRRCILLYSNPCEIVYSPFMGIGSEGYMALKLDRKFIGCELKPEYFEVAKSNLENSIKAKNEYDLLSYTNIETRGRYEFGNSDIALKD